MNGSLQLRFALSTNKQAHAHFHHERTCPPKTITSPEATSLRYLPTLPYLKVGARSTKYSVPSTGKEDACLTGPAFRLSCVCCVVFCGPHCGPCGRKCFPFFLLVLLNLTPFRVPLSPFGNWCIQDVPSHDPTLHNWINAGTARTRRISSISTPLDLSATTQRQRIIK